MPKIFQIVSKNEVWHFPRTVQYNPTTGDLGLFGGYVNCLLKLKVEASGWPPGVETEEQKQQFLDEFERREGIRLDPDKIVYNSSLRALSKLMLNSLWGK